MIRKTLLTSALAATLALSPLSATTAASQESNDLRQLLLGLVIDRATTNSLDDGLPLTGRTTNSYGDRYGNYDGRSYRDDDWNDDRDSRHDNRDWGRGHHRYGGRSLPGFCEVELGSHRNRARVFGEHCLERAGVRVERLPATCEFRVRTDRGRRTVYGSRCLQEFGYRVEARRR